MGNKRQRLARKNFKVVTGGEAAKKQNENGSEQEKNKEKTSNKLQQQQAGTKRKAGEGDGGVPSQHTSSATESKTPEQSGNQKKAENGIGSKKPGSKHPLRIPGMKPGEGCFICKGTDHIAKLCPTKTTKDRKKICLLCRSIGHTLKNCPTSFESLESTFCYNCGENGHRLAECKKPLKEGGTGFAECFVCKKKGHLSKNCPTNPHGIYPKGGCCKLCQGVTHLAKDCPTKKPGGRVKLQISTEVAQASEPGGGGKRTVFQSGDDLGDDFASDDEVGNAIVGALSYGSDDEMPDSGLGTVRAKSTPKSKSNKAKNITKETPSNADSTKLQRTPKIIKFQRPK